MPGAASLAGIGRVATTVSAVAFAAVASVPGPPALKLLASQTRPVTVLVRLVGCPTDRSRFPRTVTRFAEFDAWIPTVVIVSRSLSSMTRSWPAQVMMPFAAPVTEQRAIVMSVCAAAAVARLSAVMPFAVAPLTWQPKILPRRVPKVEIAVLPEPITTTSVRR
ncbi:hypothetical protein amrb99_98160 [Actinomadura sp. RB99]|nr:hypothetical protein [Actinomadura sp. RB99]